MIVSSVDTYVDCVFAAERLLFDIGDEASNITTESCLLWLYCAGLDVIARLTTVFLYLLETHAATARAVIPPTTAMAMNAIRESLLCLDLK